MPYGQLDENYGGKDIRVSEEDCEIDIRMLNGEINSTGWY